MQSSRSQSCHEVENQELLGAQCPFQDDAEHQQRVHIEEYVPESAVHEHVRQDLPRLEERRSRIEHGEVHHHEILIDESGDENKYVDSDDILRYRRN